MPRTPRVVLDHSPLPLVPTDSDLAPDAAASGAAKAITVAGASEGEL